MSDGGIVVIGLIAVALFVATPIAIVFSINDLNAPLNTFETAPPVTLEPTSGYPTLLPSTSTPTTLSPTLLPTTASPTPPSTHAPSLSPVVVTQEPTLSPMPAPVFSIEVTYNDTYSAEVISAVDYSVASWQSIIAAPLDTFAILVPGNWCGYVLNTPTVIQDLRVHVFIYSIDGVGNILGQAGPCATDDDDFPRFGTITLDLDDVNDMILDGSLNEVMRHEFGHVLGLGTLWSAGTTYTASGMGSGHPYIPQYANQAHQSLDGSGPALVEDVGGSGTVGSHWKETFYDHELMTGFVEASGAMPLSNLTVSALRDLGYQVRNENAESYSLPGSRRRLRQGTIRHYHHCTDNMPQPVTVTTQKKGG